MAKADIKALLGVKNANELTPQEAVSYLDGDEDSRFFRNNYLCNDLLETLYQQKNIEPTDAVEIAILALVKVTIGSSQTLGQAEMATMVIVNRFVDLVRGNIGQIGNDEALFNPKGKKI